MTPTALLEAPEKTADLIETPRAERVIWHSRRAEGALGSGRRRVWTLERRRP